MELQARGYGKVEDKYVCADCFNNKGIKDFIERNATFDICSYCGKTAGDNGEPIAASLEDVVGLIVNSIRRLYEDPINSLPYDNEDGRYVGIVDDLNEVLYDMGLELTASDNAVYDALFRDLIKSIDNDQWTERGAFSKNEAYQAGWRRFVEQVKHNSRYVFSLIKFKPDPYESLDTPLPSKILPKILSLITSSQLRIIKEKKTSFYRVRIVHKGETVNDCAKELGTPPNEFTRYANRMSPAGIPMFYGALDEKTAIEEVMASETDKNNISAIKIARFVLLKDITVVDFSKRQEYCLFDEDVDLDELNTKAFLNHFVRELSEPIKKDGREHIDYVPTQIVAEYLKYKCRALYSKRRRIRGILYPSSRCEGVSCSLFIRNEGCIDPGERNPKAFLRLVHVDTKRL